MTLFGLRHEANGTNIHDIILGNCLHYFTLVETNRYVGEQIPALLNSGILAYRENLLAELPICRGTNRGRLPPARHPGTYGFGHRKISRCPCIARSKTLHRVHRKFENANNMGDLISPRHSKTRRSRNGKTSGDVHVHGLSSLLMMLRGRGIGGKLFPLDVDSLDA